MRQQLDGSYNIQTIIQLEDDQANKLRILKSLEIQNSNILKIQRDEKRAIRILRKSGNYEKKFTELNIELKQAKEHYRKL